MHSFHIHNVHLIKYYFVVVVFQKTVDNLRLMLFLIWKCLYSRFLFLFKCKQ